MLANYAICNVQCNAESALGDTFMNCGEVNWAQNAKDCLKSCIFAMLPIPDPCGVFGKLFGALVGSLGGGGGNGDNSFTGDTLVHVRDRQGKPALKPISDIKIGDEVLAWDELAAHDGQLKQSKNGNSNSNSQEVQTKTGASAQQISATRYEKVSDVFSSERERKLVHITLNNGKSLTVTDGHPFRTSEGWRDAILLKKGGKLLLKGSGDGDDDSAGAATIADVRFETKTVRVYNLEVESLHTFFVGVDGVVVHNGIPIPPRGRGAVPPSQRDPSRVWKEPAQLKKWKEQGERCPGCGQNVPFDETEGHHKDRHADGGRTNRKNHLQVCIGCHCNTHYGKKRG